LKLLFDTNIVLDLLLDRQPHSRDAAFLTSQADKDLLTGYLCATTLTTIYYLSSKAADRKHAFQQVKKLIRIFEIASVNRAVIEGALASKLNDFEDAVIEQAAVNVAVEGIVTRDRNGFKGSMVPVYSPDEIALIFRERKRQDSEE